MADPFNIEERINKSVSKLDNWNQMLGRTLLQPFKPHNSGSRALMNSIHTEQFLVPKHPMLASYLTGYENEYGENSSSYIEAETDYEVIYRIEKFAFKPGHHYYLIVIDKKTGIYDVIERVSYNHNTESFGYLWNNERLDALKPGSTIRQGDIVKTSTGFDYYGNKMNGVDLLTMYVSSAQNLEDSLIISDEAAELLESVLVMKTSILVNDNDVLKDKYGDGNTYKVFPDIGEQIKDGIFCSIRRIENSNILYNLSRARLREDMLSDRNIILDGVVADIDIYCNNPQMLEDSYYNQQLYFYYKEKMRFCKEINDLIAPIDMNGTMTGKLKDLYAQCRDITLGKQFYKNNQFNGILMDVVVIEDLPMGPGDKMVDRYGGKGVVSIVLPKEMMPMLDNGRRVQVLKNQPTCINRENMGQIDEQSMNFIAMRLIDIFKTGVFTPVECCRMWYKFMTFVDQKLADEVADLACLEDEYEAKVYLDMLLDSGRIIICDEPFTTNINIDTLSAIYDEFPFIKPCTVTVPMVDSNGNIRYIPARRPLVAAPIYHYRLKQYAEEKFSVTSLAATNLKNLNTRSKANKMYEAKHTNTPIMFGPMESGDMAHMGVKYVVMNLMQYASSPQARQLFEQLLTGDPYDIDIKLDKDSKNRNAEIINALIKTMGLRLVFEKTPKLKKQLCTMDLCTVVRNKDFKPKSNIRDLMGRFDEMELKYNAAMMEDPNENPLIANVMCKIVDKPKVELCRISKED